MPENNTPQTNDVSPKQASTEDKSKVPRNPRWTIQDTFVLIQAKQAVENRGSKSSVFGSDTFEPKWDFVSSFCKQHDVDRGPVQCRKRWSNIVCDFRKVKMWESQVRTEAESYWTMRTESRRENKLPGFFDREVYALLDGEALAVTAYPLRSVSDDTTDADEEEHHRESVLKNNTLILDENGSVMENNALMIKENESLPEIDENEDKEACAGNSTDKTCPTRVPKTVATEEKHPSKGCCSEPIFREGRKRKQTSLNGYKDSGLKKRLSEVLEKNFLMINAQLEAQNMNFQLDREQKKDQDGNLVDALAKIADALGRIADKL